MRDRGAWRTHARVLAYLILIGIGILAGCESVSEKKEAASTSSAQSTSSTSSTSTTSPGTIDVAGITLTAGTTSLVANGTSSTAITAALLNSAGKPSPDGLVVTFSTDKGRFTTSGAKSAAATTTQGSGMVLVPFISEPGVVGTATVVANVKGVAQSIQIALTGAGPPASIILSADATGISLNGTTGITAQVLDAAGNKVADGTAVFFTTSLTGTGVTPSSTTTNGVASAVFSAGTRAGVATVTATAGLVSATVSITIRPGSAGSLDFVSANPTAIGIRGSALPQKSTITFRVRDQNGNPVADGTVVTFTLVSGVGGGEFVAPTTVGTVGGVASTILTSGTVSGPVRVRASVTVVDSATGAVTVLSSSSTNVSMEGGPPSGAHFGVAPSFLNVAGQVFFDIICPIDAKVGDRFGNPVPPGTAVSFFTNGGIVSAQAPTKEDGDTVGGFFKTAPPIPHVGTSASGLDPRTGMVTIIAVTQGEETFIDSNGDGLFSGPQEFDPSNPELDTPEPFIDHVMLCDGSSSCPADPIRNPPLRLSGNNRFDPSDPFELFIDANSNGMWDANKPIFASTRVLFSGPTVLIVDDCKGGSPGGFVVKDGGSAGPFCIFVSDPGGHPLVSGTKLTVTTTAGAIAGTSGVTLPDTQQSGPGSTQFVFFVFDDKPGDTDPPKAAAVTVAVTSPPTTTCPGGNGSVSVSFGGSVD